MHRNTYLLIFMLGLLAALVAGVNIAKKFQKEEPIPTPTPTPIITIEPTMSTISSTPAPTIKVNTISPTKILTKKMYTNAACGFTVTYFDSLYTLKEISPVNATLIDTGNQASDIVLLCQNEIPKPALTADRMETKVYGTVTATLYHDQSAKDGTPIDGLIYRHPTKNVDVLIAGYGAGYNELLTTLVITK